MLHIAVDRLTATVAVFRERALGGGEVRAVSYLMAIHSTIPPVSGSLAREVTAARAAAPVASLTEPP
jgi:hypothetical protein